MQPIAVLLLVLCISMVPSRAHAQAQKGTPPPPANPRQHMMAATNPESTLRHLIIYQEIFKSGHGRYSASADSISLDVPEGVTVRIVPGPNGYAAVAASRTQECAVFRGDARSPRSYARTADRITCVPRRPGGR